MPKEIVSTDDAPKGLAGYSQAVKANGLVFVSGQGPFDPVTGKVVGETIEEQTRQCLRNVAAILKAAGSSIDGVVQATFILADESETLQRPITFLERTLEIEGRSPEGRPNGRPAISSLSLGDRCGPTRVRSALPGTSPKAIDEEEYADS